MAEADRRPEISVVICTRNRAGVLRGALDSLEQQTADSESFEVLVVDNDSSDGTAELVAAYPRVRHAVERRIGLSNARNRGISETSGRYVGYTDDDCKLPPRWIEVALEIAHERAPEVFGGPYRGFYRTARPAWFKEEYGSRDRGETARCLDSPDTLPGGNVFFRRDVLEALGGFDGRLGMAGRRVAYGEESDLQERLRAERPESEIYYEPQLCVEHLVRREKMRVGWALRAGFGKGLSAQRARWKDRSETDEIGAARLLARLVYTAAGAFVDGTLAPLWRDRQRYPRAQNYIWEHTSQYFRSLGRLWGVLTERKRRARRDGRR